MVKRNPPLVDQVKLEMLSKIHAGTMADADGRIPSEASLATEFNVSRATVREALAQLSLAGIIVRRHGVGNFLRIANGWDPRSFWSWLDLSPSFMDLIRIVGYAPKCVPLGMETKLAGSLASVFGISRESSLLVFERIFFADDIPFIHSTTSIPTELMLPDECAEADQIGCSWDSVYQILEECCHQKVDHQTCEIRAVVADEKLSAILGCASGEPFLKLEEVGYSADERPLFHALNHFRGDLVSFRQLRWPNVNILRSKS